MRYSKLKTRDSKLAALVLAFVLLAALYSVVTPLGEGPDEPGHVAYVFFLARERRLPVQRAERSKSDVPGEGHQPPLAYALAAPLAGWLPADQRLFDQPANPRFVWSGGSETNAVAHGSREFWPWSGAVLGWHLARLVSVACGAAAVAFTYLAARELTDQGPTTKDQVDPSLVVGPSSAVPLLAAALVAFNPQFLFVSALVTNDALLAALGAAMLWLVVRRPADDEWRPPAADRRSAARAAWLPDRHRLIHAALMGLLLGLALLTKQSAIILAPIALVAVLEQDWFARRWRGVGKQQQILSPGHLVTLSVFLTTVLLVSGWWYARNLRLYGDLFGLAAFQAEFTTQAFEPGRLDAWVGALKQLHSSLWARFGWMNVRPPGWAIWFFTAVEVVSAIGWIRGLAKDQRPRTKDQSDGPNYYIGLENEGQAGLWSFVLGLGAWWALLALPLLALAWIVGFALTAGLVAWQGRLLFPALPAIAILLAAGLSAWRRTTDAERQTKIGRRPLVVDRWSLVVTLAAIAAWLPFGAIRPAYTIYTLPERAALDRLGTPANARIARPGDPGAELRGWRLDGIARPGEALDLGLTWHALGRQDRNWTVFVHLVDAQEHIVAEDNREPRDGAFPTKQWVAGDWVEDRHPLALPANLAPGTYDLRVGMWYPRTGRRAAAYDQKGKLIGDSLLLGQVTVRSGG